MEPTILAAPLLMVEALLCEMWKVQVEVLSLKAKQALLSEMWKAKLEPFSEMCKPKLTILVGGPRT